MGECDGTYQGVAVLIALRLSIGQVPVLRVHPVRESGFLVVRTAIVRLGSRRIEHFGPEEKPIGTFSLP